MKFYDFWLIINYIKQQVVRCKFYLNKGVTRQMARRHVYQYA